MLKSGNYYTCYIFFQSNHERNPVEEMQAAEQSGSFVFVSDTLQENEEEEEEEDFKEAEDVPVSQVTRVRM